MGARREFLEQGLISGAAFALFGACRPHRGAGGVDARAIGKLGARLRERLILPDDEAYGAARKFFYWNPATDRRPGIIARCQQPDDVAQCVEFARQHDLILAVRGGGHGYLGWSTCDDGLVIDLAAMKEIAIDPDNRTVRAGAGVLAHELVEATARHGLAPVVGQCRQVGISGLTLGGGLGWLSGRYGATCDNLLSADLITADCRAVVANAAEHPDLFWAIRGGGGNFGIATAFEYRLHPLTTVLAGVLTYRLSDARAMLGFYRDFMAEAPDELQALGFLRRDRDPSLSVVVCYSGDPSAGENVVRALRTRAKPVGDTVRLRPYSETFSDAAGDHRTFRHVRGCYLESLPTAAIDVVLDRFAQAPSGAAIGLDHYMHGAVCRIPPASTAFELRRPGALHVWITTRWNGPSSTAAMIEWCEETWQALQPYSAGRIYANYANAEGEAAARAAYGENYSRLLAVKNEYDPGNVFRRNQNVRPTSA